jgi:hypothetical protein
VWVEIEPDAQSRLQEMQQPVAEQMREVTQQFKADELAIVRDYMRQAKEVFQRQVRDAVHEATSVAEDAQREAHQAAREATRGAREAAQEAREAARQAREAREEGGGGPE